MAATAKTLFSVGEAARELGALEHHVRKVMRSGRPYVVRVGRYRAIAPDDLPRLAADLKAAGMRTAADPQEDTDP